MTISPHANDKQPSQGSHFENLPDDILNNVIRRLSVDELLRLQLNHNLQARIQSLGIPTYNLHHPLPHLTLSSPASSWPPPTLLRYNTHITRSIEQRRWHALQLGRDWGQSVIPVLEVTANEVMLGVGGKLVIHPLKPRRRGRGGAGRSEGFGAITIDGADRRMAHGTTSTGGDGGDHFGGQAGIRSFGPNGSGSGSRSSNGKHYGAKVVHRSREFHVSRKYDGSKADIVGIAPLSSSSSTAGMTDDICSEVITAQYNGTIQRFSFLRRDLNGPEHDRDLDPELHSNSLSSYRYSSSEVQPPSNIRSTAHYTPLPGGNIHNLSHDSDAFLTTTSNALMGVYKVRSPWTDPSTFTLPPGESRAWSSLLSTTSPSFSPTIFLGLSSSISLHPLLPSGPIPTPTRTLVGPEPPSRSSAYDIHLPPSSHTTHHPQLLLSAWYDSHLRLHDLRTPSPLPIMEFSDPWTWADGSAMYSATWVGEHHLAGGGARHGTVAFFDVRNNKKGWSCFSPGGKGSPVYALRGEGGRVWGVTEKRAFVCTFDGSGDEVGGLVSDELAEEVGGRMSSGSNGHGGHERIGNGNGGHGHEDRWRGRHVPSGWKGRGGRWSWTVRYDKDEGKGVGYDHAERGVKLFDGLPLVL